MKFNYNDGGRAEAGYKGKAKGDCACRAIAIATERPYSEIHSLINHFAKKERTGKRKRSTSNAETGVYGATMHRIMEYLGWQWVPCMGIGTGCKVHLDSTELPQGRIIASVSRHYVAVIDGTINDNHNPSRGGKRCVYGYYMATEHAVKPSDTLRIALDAPGTTQGRPASKDKINTAPNAGTRQKHRTARYDEWGCKCMTYAEIRREAEAMIPPEVRDYYLGCEIDRDSNGNYTSRGSDIWLNFKCPVITEISDARYIHGTLETIPVDLATIYYGDNTPDENADYEEYDAEMNDKPIVPIKVPYRPYDRKTTPLRWNKQKVVKIKQKVVKIGAA